MSPRVPTAPASWDPVIIPSGPCNQMVHRAPTNEVSTDLWISLLIFPLTDGKKNLFFLLPWFSICSDSPWLKEKNCPFGEDWHYFYHVRGPSFHINPDRMTLHFPFLSSLWFHQLLGSCPFQPNCLEELTPLCSQNLLHDSWLCQESPWRQLPGNPVTKLQLTVAKDEVHFSVPSKQRSWASKLSYRFLVQFLLFFFWSILARPSYLVLNSIKLRSS